MNPLPAIPRMQQLQRLREALRGSSSETGPVLSTGLSPLDELLPQGGLRPGAVVEWLSERAGGGASLLAWLMVRGLQRNPQMVVVVVDSLHEFYPPGVAHLGIDLDRVVVVQPASLKETLWTYEQTLRSAARVVTVGFLEQIPHSTYRRLKLAAQRGGSIGIFLRSWEARGAPTWADVRWLATPLAAHPPSRARRIKVSLLSMRGSHWTDRTIVLRVSDETDSVCVDSELAGAAAPGHVSRAS